MKNKIVKKIFVVDDDEMMLVALDDYLKRKTMHEVFCFNTGEKCIQNLKEGPDIVILDYTLNSVTKNAANGMAILETIKKLDPAIKVIMLSSQAAYGVALQTLTKGATEYVIKDEAAFEKIAALCN